MVFPSWVSRLLRNPQGRSGFKHRTAFRGVPGGVSPTVWEGRRLQQARRRALGVLCASGLSLLAACVGPAPIQGSGSAFERTGRFAVNVSDSDAPPEAAQGGFAWRDDGTRLQLDLVNPLGTTLARITVAPEGARLDYADGAVERAADADALVEKVMGTALPVANLRDWLRGQVGKAPVSGLERDPQGRPTAFSQEGWQIRLSRYDESGPGLLRLDRRVDTRQVSVRLAVDAARP